MRKKRRQKLFLTSAGLSKAITQDFIKLLGKNPKNVNICFIPTAAYPEINRDFLEEDKKNLKDIGCKITELDIKSENKESLKRKLKKFDVILVGGGNTFYLLKYIRKSGFSEIIPDLLKQGKIYFGISAGSMVVGPNIEVSCWKTDWDKNIVKLKDLTGMKLVSFAVSPHFTKKDRKVLNNKSKSINYPIIALNDRQAVIVQDNEIKIIGKGKKVIFNNPNGLLNDAL